MELVISCVIQTLLLLRIIQPDHAYLYLLKYYLPLVMDSGSSSYIPKGLKYGFDWLAATGSTSPKMEAFALKNL